MMKQGSYRTVGEDRFDPLADMDLTDPEFVTNPHGILETLQQKTPVAWNNQLKGWIVTRFDDVDFVLRSPHTSVEKLQPFVAHSSSSDRVDIELLGDVLSDWMLFADPPHHTKLRRALKDAFMPAEIKALTPRVQATIGELLDSLPVGQDIDMVSRFSAPLPALVIGDLFGLPRSDQGLLKEWSDPLGRFVLASTNRENLYSNAANAVRAMKARLLELVDEHRQAPRDNFTSRMLANAGELSDDEIVHSLIVVLWAGHDTTSNHLATVLHYLCARPDLFHLLRQNLDLIPGAVEEFLRLDSPAHMMVRLVKEDIEVSGQKIKAGERIFAMMNTANRDPQKFAEPNQVQVDRAKNRHLSFGKGMHGCLGAPLARLEGVQALTALCERYSDIRFAAEPATWRQNLIMRGPSYLPVRLTSAGT